jgi:hypothetical protein
MKAREGLRRYDFDDGCSDWAIGLKATPMSIGHDFGFAAPHPDAVTRNSRAGTSSFPCCDVDHDDITDIAMIGAIF